MLKISQKKFSPLDIGTTVLVPIADLDRSKVDARNAVGVILEVA